MKKLSVTAAFLKRFQRKRTALPNPRHERPSDSSTSSEERKWSIGIDNIYDNGVVVRQHLRARAGAARKAIEIREESQPPGRIKPLQFASHGVDTRLNQISTEGGFLERYSRSCSGPLIDFLATLG